MSILVKIILLSSFISLAYAGPKEKILIFTPQGDEFNVFIESFKEEFERYEVIVSRVKHETSLNNMLKTIRSTKPKGMVLLDNISVQKVKSILDEKYKIPPAVATLAVNLQKSLEGYTDNIAGVGYEVNGYILVREYNKIVDKDIRKINVVYRQGQQDAYILDSKRLLKREGIELVEISLKSNDAKGVNKEIESLKDDVFRGADAYWLILDSIIVNKENFLSTWIKSSKTAGIPFLCGIRKFVESPINMCSFAAYPNTRGLSQHVADIMYSILEEGATTEEYGVEYLVVSDKVLNKKNLDRMGIKLEHIKIDNLDIIDE